MMGLRSEVAPLVELRSADEVMRLDRMGAAHATRLSFVRVLLRRAASERWIVTRTEWAIGDDGFGHAVYRVEMPGSTVSLVAFSCYLASENRTDRVIAEAWDTGYVLYDGIPTAAEIQRLKVAVPKQEAARYTDRELILSRANRSVRLFDHVVDALSRGYQPDATVVEPVGYLMRTTAVYGNGKFGIADRNVVARHPALRGSFQAEMLTVWLIRTFTVDLAEHCARARSPTTAVALNNAIRRKLGVGNATGLGMAPFLVKHPLLLHQWVGARETALQRVRSIATAGPRQWDGFLEATATAQSLVAAWTTDEPIQRERIAGLAADLRDLVTYARKARDEGYANLWERIWQFAETELSLEAQEMTVALLLEPHGELIDDLAATAAIDEDAAFRIDGTMTCKYLANLIDTNAKWATTVDLQEVGADARFWYASEEKLEPRLGERLREPGAQLELPMATAIEMQTLRAALHGERNSTRLAEFLLENPEHRHTVRRLQQAALRPYADIRDNLIAAAMRPIDILRLKLAFFGATCFDPRSDRWLRITLFRDAPFTDEIAQTSP
jgi:hypothetical protein